jgi:hypothetical protein
MSSSLKNVYSKNHRWRRGEIPTPKKSIKIDLFSLCSLHEPECHLIDQTLSTSHEARLSRQQVPDGKIAETRRHSEAFAPPDIFLPQIKAIKF